MASHRRLRVKRELEELFEDPREAGLNLKELLAEDKSGGVEEAAGPLKQLGGQKGLLGGGTGNIGDELEALLEEKTGGRGEREPEAHPDGAPKADKADPFAKGRHGEKGALTDLAIGDLGRLGPKQRADAMHGLQKRVGNQAVVDELLGDHRKKLEKASGDFERDVFPRIYMQNRHKLKQELFLRLWITEDHPVVGDFPEDWKRWRAQRKERVWWDCLADKPKGQEKRDSVGLQDALREIAAFKRLGMPCPAFDDLLERERRRYLEGKRLSPV